MPTDPQFAAQNSHWRWRIAEILPLLALTLWAYWGCLKNPFHFDDSLFLQSPQVTEPGDPLHFLKPSQSRQLFYLSLFMNYRLGGRNPAGYHLFNLILHLANALGIYLLARLLCQRKSDLSDSLIRRWLPFAAAGIFALHPIQSQAVNYVYQRSTLLAAFFTLAAMCAFVWSEQTRRRGLFFLLAGIFSSLPRPARNRLYSALVLAVYCWCYEKELALPGGWRVARRFLIPLAALSLAGAAYTLYTLYRLGGAYPGPAADRSVELPGSQVTVLVLICGSCSGLQASRSIMISRPSRFGRVISGSARCF